MMAILGIGGQEKRTQLFFRDDGKFQFRRLPLEDTFLVLKKGGIILKGWKHLFKTQFPFTGHGRIPADMVTLGFDRDIILDPFNMIDPDDKPDSWHPEKTVKPGQAVVSTYKKGISDVAEGQRYKHQMNPGNMLLVDKITMFLGIGTLMIILAMAIRAVAN